jgi:hypothetical protein
MKRILVLAAAVAALSLLAPAASAAEATEANDPSLPQASKRASAIVRSDSLEMPGITACHQCEWRPKPNNMGAADQCGVGPDGNAKLAEFECGFTEDCQRLCTFVRCLQP